MFRNGLKQRVWLADDNKSLIALRDKYQVSSDKIYFLLIDPSNDRVYNFSWMLQKYPFQEALSKFSSICQNKDIEGVSLKHICP